MREYQVADDGSVMTAREVSGAATGQAATLTQRHAYYEKHRPEIVADIETLGGFQTRQKWGIPTGSWYNIRRRWHGPIRKKQIRQLPPWNEQWSDDVKLAWLNTYGQVFGVRQEEGTCQK